MYGLLIYEWVQTGLATDAAFDNFVYNYGVPGELVQFHNTWFSVTIMCAFVSFVVQTFFAWRIWILGRSKILTGIILFVRTMHRYLLLALSCDSAADMRCAVDFVCPDECRFRWRYHGKFSWIFLFLLRLSLAFIASRRRPHRCRVFCGDASHLGVYPCSPLRPNSFRADSRWRRSGLARRCSRCRCYHRSCHVYLGT